MLEGEGIVIFEHPRSFVKDLVEAGHWGVGLSDSVPPQDC
jgi:hypothetical protein